MSDRELERESDEDRLLNETNEHEEIEDGVQQEENEGQEPQAPRGHRCV